MFVLELSSCGIPCPRGEEELSFSFKINQFPNESASANLERKGKKNNIESCHFNEQPLVGLHKVKVIKFSPDV